MYAFLQSINKIWFCLVFLWHINHCRLFNAKPIFIHINSSVSNNSVEHFSSIRPIDRTLSGATTPGQSGFESDANEGVLSIPQSSTITGTSPSDCLTSYPGAWLVGGLNQLHRRNWCILLPLPSGQYTELNVKTVYFK